MERNGEKKGKEEKHAYLQCSGRIIFVGGHAIGGTGMLRSLLCLLGSSAGG